MNHSREYRGGKNHTIIKKSIQGRKILSLEWSRHEWGKKKKRMRAMDSSQVSVSKLLVIWNLLLDTIHIRPSTQSLACKC